jgi:hypothetical protein
VQRHQFPDVLFVLDHENCGSLGHGSKPSLVLQL